MEILWGPQTNQLGQPITIPCGGCGSKSATVCMHGFEFLDQGTWIEIARCPDPGCRTVHVVWGARRGGGHYEIEGRIPPPKNENSVAGAPARVNELLAETFRCRDAGCRTATGMLIRKTMEVMCEELGCGGSDLNKRLGALEAQGLLPPVLIKSAHELRFFGNDFAHVESRHYENVDDETIGLAIELLVSILVAAYKHEDLVTRLQAARKDASSVSVQA